MQINYLDHVNIRTTRLDTMIAWYSKVLGMRQGVRPDFKFPGAWMYVGDRAPVHLSDVSTNPGNGSGVKLKLEHFAFSGTGRAEFESKLKKMGIDYRLAEVPSFNVIQVNLWDPDGNHIHVDFPADE